jgi:Transcriptional regulator PadR-like family
VSRDVLRLNEGTVYTSLLRLQQQGWIRAEWGTSENNRKAKFYAADVVRTSPEFFKLFGVTALMGRFFAPDERLRCRIRRDQL